MTNIDITPPAALDAEKALLGAVLIAPHAYWDVASFLRPDDFWLERNRWVFQAISALHERREPVDYLTVLGELEKRKQLDQVGGPLGLSQLMDGVPSAIHAEAYGREVERAAVRRRLLGAAGEIAKLAYDQKIPLTAVLERSESQLFSISERRSTGNLEHVATAANAYYDRIMAMLDGEPHAAGPTTGYVDLDRLLGGMGEENVTIVAGRPGMGKTSFLLGIVAHVAELPDLVGPVAFFSLEMSREQIVNRLVAARSEVDAHRMAQGKLRESEQPKVIEAFGWLGGLPLYIDDTPGLSPVQLRSRCRRIYAERGGIRLIVVDYAQLMLSDRRYESKVQETAFISQQIKALARELKVPVLVAAQLNRSCEMRRDKRPILSDLKESGALEQDADAAIFLYRDEYYKKEASEKPGVAEVELAKHRHGPTGKLEMFWQSWLMKFRPLEKRR